MRKSARATRLVADFFTQSYRISGSIDVASRKLADQLEDATTAFLKLESAYISNVQQPAEIVAGPATSVLRRESIIAALVPREEDGLAQRYSYGSYFGSHVQRAQLIVPGYEIRGYVRLPAKRDLRAMLVGADRFLPVLDGEMSFSVRPDVRFSGGMILVNRAHVVALWKEEEPTGG